MVLVVVEGSLRRQQIVPTVPLLTAANYSVLGASEVTNTGGTTLGLSLGLWPGTSITGFPPGLVIPPGTTNQTNAAAQQAQSDLTAAYMNAAGRPVNANASNADLGGLILGPGVYAAPTTGGPLSVTGIVPLVLDGEGNPNAVFIFQTDSTLITGSASVIELHQRRPGMQRLLAGRQLGDARHRLDLRRQHPRPDLGHRDQRRHGPRSGARPDCRRDDGQRHVHRADLCPRH